ncbi:MAG: DegT/DnrJ/EryC1/StrS family aminotransferase [Alphaproteobacteria bacterium]|nr:DegT/DnrJ/EryC1/StrS family aminotransferase [Alphaproteobacteria bacterium]
MAIASLPEQPARKPIAFIDLAAQQALIRSRLEVAIKSVLDEGNYILGRQVGELENQLADFCGARNCITCANGTDALRLVLMAEDIGPGDAVILPAFTFVATAEAVLERGATAVFADVDIATFNICAESVSRCVQHAKAEGLKPRAIIAVDLFGLPADYPALKDVATAEGLTVIADGAQSLGASLHGRAVGTLADYTTTSFYPAKPLGCYGDGGGIFTESDTTRELLKSLRLHGTGARKYEHDRVGLNSRLDTLQAVILLEKLKLFPSEIESRNRIADRYASSLRNLVAVPSVPEGARSVWAQYTVILPDGAERGRIQGELQQAGVPTAIHYPGPIARMGGYQHCPSDPRGLEVSDQLAGQVLSLPMHPYLDEETQDYICRTFRHIAG